MDNLDLINNFVYLYQYYCDILKDNIDNNKIIELVSILDKAKDNYLKTKDINILSDVLEYAYNFINNRNINCTVLEVV